VWLPTVCPRRSISRTISGSASAILPTLKKVAFVQCASSALSTAVV
jgi:hypothetical protein